MHALRVECRTSEGSRLPVRFGCGDAVQQVAEILDRWPGEGYCYFRVRTGEGGFYILRHDERDDSWRISVYQRSDPLPEEGMSQGADQVRTARGDSH